MLARVLLGSLLFQQLVHGHPAGIGILIICRGHTVVDKPGEVIAHARLTCLEAEETGNDAVFNHAAHPLNDSLFLAEYHVAD